MSKHVTRIGGLGLAVLLCACSGSDRPAQLSDIYGVWTRPNARMTIEKHAWWKFWASDWVSYRSASRFVPRQFQARIMSSASAGTARDGDRSVVTLGLRLSDELITCRVFVARDYRTVTISNCLGELNGPWRVAAE